MSDEIEYHGTQLAVVDSLVKVTHIATNME